MTSKGVKIRKFNRRLRSKGCFFFSSCATWGASGDVWHRPNWTESVKMRQLVISKSCFAPNPLLQKWGSEYKWHRARGRFTSAIPIVSFSYSRWFCCLSSSGCAVHCFYSNLNTPKLASFVCYFESKFLLENSKKGHTFWGEVRQGSSSSASLDCMSISSSSRP